MTSSLSAGAAIFVPRSLQSVAPAGDQHDSTAMTAVRTAMSSLTASPGSYHEVMPKLVNNLKNACKTNADVTAVVSYIFNLGVSTSSIRYTCARMFVYLNKHLSSTIIDGVDFRAHLINKCNEEAEKAMGAIGQPDKLDFLSGTILFMGEIFLNMISSTGSRMGEIGSKLNQIVQEIMKYAHNRDMTRLEENVVIAVIDVIKMTGAILAQCEHFKKHGKSKEAGPPRLQDMLDWLFSPIENIIVSSKASRRIRMKLLSLVKLRANNFGLKNKSYDGICLETIDCPVFYYNAGHIYSLPEAVNTHNELYGDLPAYTENGEFTGGNLVDSRSLPPDINDFIPFEEDFVYNGYELVEEVIESDDGIDEEIAEAYEEFLAERNQPSS